MSPAGNMIRCLARGVEFAGNLCQRLAILLNNLLPAVLSPAELMHLMKRHYDMSYAHTGQKRRDDREDWTLESWEQDALQRHDIAAGRILVLGAGVGREAVALAQRGLAVVGLETNRTALQVATRTADTLQVPARFVQADFLSLPFTRRQFDYAIMSGIMYSSIPGRERRQAWLVQLADHLAPGGVVLLNFLIDRSPFSRTKRLSDAMNRVVATLPGTNRSYQPGDGCAQGHFLHAFQNETEIRVELEQAGVHIRELDWKRGFSVVSFPGEPVTMTCGTPWDGSK
jgi:SAM-dependent methyltransferase